RQEYMEADRPHEGSGLGLAITSRLVKKLGGIIDVKSEVGVGTIFRVSFAAQPQLESVKRDAAASPSRAARTKSTTPEAVS
ncbi:MAG: ATP-binding protein, partial [Bacteroidetes bacterium]|nr:ATP-binding protein [Bacteroidota bacterium]